MVLTPTQRKFLDWLDSHPFGQKVYFTGGTALAYGYDHRISTDLDFFSFDFLADYELLPFIQDIKNVFGVEKVTRQNVYNRNIFLFDEHLDQLKMEFTFFPFSRKYVGNIWKQTLSIDHPIDIGINKIHAVTERQEVKDIYDLYYIMTREKVGLEDLILGVEEKFGTALEKRDIVARLNFIAKDIETIRPYLVGEDMNNTILVFYEAMI